MANPLSKAAIADKCVRDFNSRYPLGTRVMTYRLVNPLRHPEGETRTRSKACVLNDHTPVIWVEGKADCVSLFAVQVLKEKAAAA